MLAAIIISVALVVTRGHKSACERWFEAIDQTFVEVPGLTKEMWQQIADINGYVETDHGRVYEPAGC